MHPNVTVDRDVCDLDDLHGIEPACHVFVPGRNSTFPSHISSIIVVRSGSWTINLELASRTMNSSHLIAI
jgi:hypothetical protein